MGVDAENPRLYFFWDVYMNAMRVLGRQSVVLGLKGNDKTAIIAELVDTLLSAGLITDRESAMKVVLEREKKMSTGLQSGVAIPHGKTDTIDHLVAAIGIKKDGVEFESLDGLPAKIIVLTLSPTSRAGPHIQFLAEISKSLADATNRENILNATTQDEVIEILFPDKAAQSAA